MNDSIRTIPTIPLRGMTVFPSMITYFDVGREKSKAAVEEALNTGSEIFLIPQKDDEIESPTKMDLMQIGTICIIKQVVNLPSGIKRVLVEGINRGEIVNFIDNDNIIISEIKNIVEVKVDDIESEAFIRQVKLKFSDFLKLTAGPIKEILESIDDINDADKLVDIISSYIIISEDNKKELLQLLDSKKRLEKVLIHINEEIEIIVIEKRIKDKVNKKTDKAQKEYFLREQIKAIQEELGEGDDEKKKIEFYEKKLSNKLIPKAIIEKGIYEISRLKSVSINSQEGNVIQTYLDNLISIPFGKIKKENIKLQSAKEILDNDHYGLINVKERILDYLAVKKISKSLKSPVICLVGPPGVGKTSIAKSIAKSLNKDFVRISLGGIRDESDIRGHRKTYVGAMPGRVVEALKKSSSMNPVILFDELDKMASDYKGDPSAAMLEVLDINQNNEFRDHYLEVDIDLSKVTFIATANTLESVPRPLLDRMEIIEVNGYTYEEKFHIAKKYLIPKVLKEHSIDIEKIKFSDKSINSIINYYTRESGVRSLERVIAKVVRKAIRQIVDQDKNSIIINTKTLENYLGEKIYSYDTVSEDKVGVVNGLAWTAYGGDTLPVEVSIMNGTGKLELTGKLGDVMKESAKTAFSLVRSNMGKFGIENEDFYKNKDIHIHVPEGAVPKDGPSAGITITTALVSALSNKPAKGNVAMTGEVTLTGSVLPIGGLKEKCLAASRLGVKTIIIPMKNEKDIKDIPISIRKKLNIISAKEIDEVLKHALV